MEGSTDLLLERSVVIVRRPPELLRPEDAELFDGAARYETLDVLLRDFGPSSVSPDSVVYKGGRVVPETLATQADLPYYRFRHLIKKYVFGKRIRLGPVRHLLATDAWSVGHYHWFAEVLPRLWLVRERAGEFCLLLPDSEYVKSVGLDSLRALGLNFKDVVFMDADSLYSVDSLHYVSRLASPGGVHDRIMQEMRAKLLEGYGSGDGRLYVSRRNARFRKILNEDDVARLVSRHGFEVVCGDNMDLAGQIRAFSGSSVVLGIHGAGLTNGIFIRQGGLMIEICKRERNYGYWHLADSVGLRYQYFHGVPDSEDTLIGRGCNLTVDLAELDERLAGALS